MTANNNGASSLGYWSSGSQTFTLTGGQTYYLVADNYSSSDNASYTITVSCPSFSITAWDNPTGAGTISGAGTYDYGTSCTLTATAASGYTFDYWIKNGTETINTNPYTFTVTADADFQAHFTQGYLISDASDITTCSGTIYDSGGPNGNYSNSENYTRTIYPGTQGNVVKMTFISFDTESADHLYVYDGTSTSATQIGDYSGHSVTCPFTVEATNSTGALTFRFTSDGSVVYPGWEAEIACVEPKPVLTVSNITTNSATASWTGASSSYTLRYAQCVTAENFEAGDLSQTNLTTGSSYPWTVVANNHSGSYCAKSGNVGVSSSSSELLFTVNLAQAATLSFDYIVSSESCCDHGYFSIDGNTEFTAQGESAWENYSLTLSAGSHTLRWWYEKDSSVNNGDDCFYVDNIAIVNSAWNTATTSSTSYNMTGLTMGTWYMATVQGANSDMSNPVVFQTLNTHTLTASVSPANSGTISANGTTISGNVEYNDGTSVTLTANAATGFTFQNWTIDGSTVSDASTTITMDQDHTVVANFTLNQYTVTLNVGTGGTATGGGTYNEGTIANIEAFPDECHTFSHFIDDNNTPIYGFNPAPITVDHDMTITVVFEMRTYTINASASPSAGGTVTGGGTLDCGSSCTLTATPATNYVFDNWTENGSIVMDNGSPAGASYSFTVNGDRTLVANFHLDAVNITATAYDDSNNTTGGGTISGTGAIAIGSTCTLVATPGTGYEFVRWTENGSEVSTNATYSFTVSVARTLVAHFRLMDYTLTLAANPQAGGTVSANPAGPYHYNDVVTISATAATGYTFTSWSDNGTQSHTVTITGSASYTANFSLNHHTVTYAYTGTVPTGAPAVPAQATYYYGDAVPAAAVPTLAGYTFSGWVGEVSTMPDNDVTVTGSWTVIDYTLTLIADPVGGGTVSASPEQATYHYGDEVEVTATAKPGYTFGSWSDNGEQTHTVTIEGNTTLTAYFGADQTLTTYANPIEGGYVTIAENQVSTIGAVTVGDGTDHNLRSPFSSNTAYSFEECIYAASEINIPLGCTITSISYECTNGTSQSNHIEVFMKHVNYTTFSGNAQFEAVSDNDKVFDGIWDITAPSSGEKAEHVWNTIVLDKPFVYDGTSNLMIGIHESTPGITGGVDFCYTSVNNACINCYSSSSKPNDMVPTDINDLKSATLHERTRLAERANVRLGFGTYHYGQSVTLTAHANEGYQFVNWTENWTENSTEVGTHGDATYTVTMDADHTIYANFERLAKRFFIAGSWDNGDNWSPTGAPDITEDVYIEAAATIPNEVVATANEITIDGGSITIEDGGQLVHNNSNASANDMITVTVENTIASYDDGGENIHNKGYELISFPVEGLTAGSNAITGAFTQDPYDFYRFDANADPLEWIHMTSTDNISLLQGFIYASQNGTTVSVTGPVMSSENDVNGTAVDFLNANAPRFNGWALLGNPFVCNAYVSLGNGTGAGAEANFYKLNHTDDYDEFVPFSSGDAVTPMGGVMFRVYADDNIVYSRTAPNKGTGILNMDVNRASVRGTSTLDRARVRFGEGRNLEKFQFDTRHTKVYIPEGGNDFSVYYADGAGTIPVNFKAQDNGRYTLDFSTEDVGFNYLHLIDNMNGNDVDLLQTPYYAFDAKSTDFASRFTLVFATGNDNDDTFAFFNNGVWIINNDGDATLQVVDALGRMLSSENISGSTSKAINVAPGVYMLRLINGDKAKVQKIVVKR